MNNISQNYGWVLLFVVALLTTLSGLFVWIGSGPATFEADTGVAWDELSRVFPSVATQFATAQQGSLVGTIAVGLFALAITYFPFRGGQRWAWFTMWVLPAFMVPGSVSLARTENQAAIAFLGVAFILIAVAGQVLSIRAFFPKRA